MTDAAPRLAVVVATRGRPAALDRLLAALAAQTLDRGLFSVIVVNDGSHDRAYEAVVAPHLARRPLTYLTRPRRAGPAAARNHGACAAAADWLIFTDDDCIPPPQWLERFRFFLKNNPDAEVVGGAVLPPPGEEPGLLGRYLRDSRFIRPLLGADGDILGLPTANLAVRRERFERVGGFDARFPYPGGEDIDLTSRLIGAGARAALAEDWVTYHGVNCGWTEFCGRYFRYGYGEALLRKFSRDALPPPVSYRRKLRLLLGLAGKTVHPWAERAWDYRALTVAREVSYETGRLCASLRSW